MANGLSPPETTVDTLSKISPSFVSTCKGFQDGAAVGTLVVVVLLPLSLSMFDGELDHHGGGGSSNGPAVAWRWQWWMMIGSKSGWQ